VLADCINPARSPRRNVLDNDPLRSELVDQARVLVPEAAASTSKASSRAGPADVLAWEPAADEINGSKACLAGGANVIESLGVGPVLGEDGAAVWIGLDLPDGSSAKGSLEAKIEAADAAEE
jgi:hypothetical protein